MPTANRLSAITFFDEKFVAVGDFGGVFVSEDGAAWNTSASGVRENLNTLTAGNGLLVAAARGTLAGYAPARFALLPRSLTVI